MIEIAVSDCRTCVDRLGNVEWDEGCLVQMTGELGESGTGRCHVRRLLMTGITDAYAIASNQLAWNMILCSKLRMIKSMLYDI